MAAFRYEAVDGRGKPRQGPARRRRRARQARDRLRADGLFPTAIEPVAAAGGTAGTRRVRTAAARRRWSRCRRGSSRRWSARACRSTRRWPRSPSRPTTRARRSSSRRCAPRSSPGEPLAGALGALAAHVLRPLPQPGRRRRARPAGSTTCWCASPTTSRRGEALRQKFTLALIYPALVTVIALAVIAVLLVVRRAAGRLGLPAEPADAAVAHAGADRASARSSAAPASTGSPARLIAAGRRSRVANRRAAFRAALARARCCACRSSGASSPRSTPRASRARSRSWSAAARRCCARWTRRATSSGRCRCAARPTRAAALVREGVSVARALKEQRVFPPVLVHLVANGEASGQLAPMLERAAASSSARPSGASPGSRRCCSRR